MIIDREKEHLRLLAACRNYVSIAQIGVPPGGEHGLLLDIRTPLLQLCPIDADPPPDIPASPVTRKKRR